MECEEKEQIWLLDKKKKIDIRNAVIIAGC